MARHPIVYPSITAFQFQKYGRLVKDMQTGRKMFGQYDTIRMCTMHTENATVMQHNTCLPSL